MWLLMTFSISPRTNALFCSSCAPIGRTSVISGRRLVLDPELRPQLHQVDEGPALDDLVVGDPIGLDRPDLECLAGGRRSQEGPILRAGELETADHEVILTGQ